jgi:SPP1 gp7 family putative phage head morphogenesis protein
MQSKNDSAQQPGPGARRVLKQQDAQEEAAAREILRLLNLARQDVRDRILSHPGTVTAAIEERIERSITDALTTFGERLKGQLANEASAAAQLGIALAEADLPPPALVIRFSLSGELLEGLARYHLTLAGDVRDDTLGSIREILARGVLSGASTEALAKEIGATGLEPIGPFATVEHRAETIVRTEINKVFSLATGERLQAAAGRIPGLRKRWLATEDARTRDTHRALDGVTKAIDEDFSVGGYPAAGPHDPRLPAKEAVLCRCRLLGVVPEG